MLMRADLNVPLDDGEISDDTRIRAVLPTIEHLRERGASVVLVSHLGRPEGPDPSLSMKPVSDRIGELTEGEVRQAPAVRRRRCGPRPSRSAHVSWAGSTPLRWIAN